MHIPDGYLGPPTYLTSFALTGMLWTTAIRKLKGKIDARKVPLLSISAAFCFLVMMFNVPIPGGTTGHAVGSVLIAIAIGPWAASLAVSVSLILQALLFGDGGITAIGANCFNMAFVAPFVGYYSYFLIRKLNPSIKWISISAGIAGWLGLNAAALSTSVMFGIQPMLHTGADGRALYSPYPLSIAVPAMMIEHLFLFGIVEGLVTGLSVYFLKLYNSESQMIWTGSIGYEEQSILDDLEGKKA